MKTYFSSFKCWWIGCHIYSLQTSSRGYQKRFLCWPLLDLCSYCHVPQFPHLLIIFWFHVGLFVHHNIGIILPLLVDQCLHLQFFRLRRHSQLWCLLGQSGLGFLWCFHLGHFACLMGTHLYPIGQMSHLWCFFNLIRFQWCHHCSRLHVLTLSHLLHLEFCCLFLWLGYLGSTKKWIPLGNLCLLLLSVQAVYSLYDLIIDG